MKQKVLDAKTALQDSNLADKRGNVKLTTIIDAEQTLKKCTDDPYFTLAHYVVAVRDKNAINFMLSHGWDFEAPDADGCTPVHYAAFHGWISVLEMLDQAGVDLTLKSFSGKNVLHFAAGATFNTERLIEFLINNGFDPSDRDLYHYLPYHDSQNNIRAQRSLSSQFQLLNSLPRTMMSNILKRLDKRSLQALSCVDKRHHAAVLSHDNESKAQNSGNTKNMDPLLSFKRGYLSGFCQRNNTFLIYDERQNSRELSTAKDLMKNDSPAELRWLIRVFMQPENMIELVDMVLESSATDCIKMLFQSGCITKTQNGTFKALNSYDEMFACGDLGLVHSWKIFAGGVSRDKQINRGELLLTDAYENDLRLMLRLDPITQAIVSGDIAEYSRCFLLLYHKKHNLFNDDINDESNEFEIKLAKEVIAFDMPQMLEWIIENHIAEENVLQLVSEVIKADARECIKYFQERGLIASGEIVSDNASCFSPNLIRHHHIFGRNLPNEYVFELLEKYSQDIGTFRELVSLLDPEHMDAAQWLAFGSTLLANDDLRFFKLFIEVTHSMLSNAKDVSGELLSLADEKDDPTCLEMLSLYRVESHEHILQT